MSAISEDTLKQRKAIPFYRIQHNQSSYREYVSKDFCGKQIEPSRVFGNQYRGLKFYRPGLDSIEAPITHHKRAVYSPYESYVRLIPEINLSRTNPQRRQRNGKRPTSTMFCNHCKQGFRARPTLRPISNHFVLNHTCGNGKRTQYVLGRKHRRCQYNCDPLVGCIVFASDREEKKAFNHVLAKKELLIDD